MKIRLVARTLAALALAATIYGCSSAPQGETEAKSEAALRPVCNPFEALECTNEGLHGSVVCQCRVLTGPVGTPVLPQLPDYSGAALAPPSELAGCTRGLEINGGQVWLCPVGTDVTNFRPFGGAGQPWIANDQAPFVSNCVGNVPVGSDYVFVGFGYEGDPGGGCSLGCKPGGRFVVGGGN